MTQTVRTRPRSEVPADAAPTISTTQELPPPPPGRWARFGTWLRTSPVPRRLVIIVPVVALLVAGFVSGRDGGHGMLASAAETVAGDEAALDEWRTAADPILAEIEAAEAAAADAVAAGDGDAVVAQCRAAWERMPTWTDALLPAPDPEVDRGLRAELARLNGAFSSCALSS